MPSTRPKPPPPRRQHVGELEEEVRRLRQRLEWLTNEFEQPESSSSNRPTAPGLAGPHAHRRFSPHVRPSPVRPVAIAIRAPCRALVRPDAWSPSSSSSSSAASTPRRPDAGNAQQIDDLLFYGVLGVILGGRLGYAVLQARLLPRHPPRSSPSGRSGMAFHGGFLGVLVAMWLFGRRTQRPWLAVTDFIAPLVPSASLPGGWATSSMANWSGASPTCPGR
jgi:hypothetical protein